MSLAVDLCCGLGGWTRGLLDEGWDVVGFDIERHVYGADKYPAQLVLQDIRTLDGRQFRGKVKLITASPPCQEFSYMAMPWRRGKQIALALRGGGDFPDGYTKSRTVAELTALFDACVRIGSEAECPIVIENVRGAQPWVGRSRYHYGSFHLWGDVPALMPVTKGRIIKQAGSMTLGVQQWCREGIAGIKTVGHPNKRDGYSSTAHLTNKAEHDWVKQSGISGQRANGKGDRWFQDGAARHGSKSNARKAATATIAKIPLVLSRHIARVYFPR